MNFWKTLTDPAQLELIKKESSDKPVIIFKHSTRCSISQAALNRFERSWKAENGDQITPYYLDLLQFRPISNQIANDFSVTHESPQVLLIENGTCTLHQSHMDIRLEDLLNKTGVKN